MAVVWVPPLLRTMTGGAERVTADGDTLGRVFDALERAYPRLRGLLIEDGRLRAEIAVSIDGEVSQLDLLQPVRADSEVHIIPAIGGGAGDITGIAGVLIATERLDEMATFYRNVLGLPLRSQKESHVNFEWGTMRLTLFWHSAVRGPAGDPDRIIVNLEVADIRATYERLRDAGVAFERAPEQEPWGGWLATFHDPDGNTLQLLQPPR